MIYFYSSTICAFIIRLEKKCKAILEKEGGLKTHGQRFYYHDSSYPINIICFEHPKKLGYFDSEFYEIGINKAFLLPQYSHQLPDLLRHELAHYLAFIIHKDPALCHNTLYRTICHSYGWGKEVYAATTELGEIPIHITDKEQRILNKVKKLLSLATSNNSHEAEQATLKSNALLLKYNLEGTTYTDHEKEYVIKRLLSGKRNNSKLQALAKILRSFLVRTVINYGEKRVYLEAFGTKANVCIADYVAEYLERELEKLWKETQKQHPQLKGQASKNSFFRGLAEGYCQKITEQSQDHHHTKQQSLVVLEKQLDVKMQMAYPSLRQTSSHYRSCSQSTALGFEEGKSLNIRKPLSDTSTHRMRYLPSLK